MPRERPRETVAMLRLSGALIDALRRLLEASSFSGLGPIERAELELLAAAPQDFISCTARRGRGQAGG